jgi:molybdopterin molybdotransferase
MKLKNEKIDSCYSEELMTVSEMLKRILEFSQGNPGAEGVKIGLLSEQVLAIDVISEINVPQFDNSAMDGYGINMAKESVGKIGGSKHNIVGKVFAGDNIGRVLEDECVRIFTGAKIPSGINMVAMQEDCDQVNGVVEVYKPMREMENIRLKGEDIKKGSIILKKGFKLNPQSIGLLVSTGCKEIKVYKKIKVGIFFTGDELVEPGEPINDGQIYNSNRYTIKNQLIDDGCEVIDLGIIKDRLSETKNAILKLAGDCDLIITTGGVSVGEADYVKDAIEDIGELKLWKVKMKPGKPVVVGQVKKSIFIGLPGNPVSAMVAYMIFTKPLIRKMQGQSNILNTYNKVIWDGDVIAPRSRDEYLRAQVQQNDQGISMVKTHKRTGSNILSSMVWADGLLEVKSDRVYKKGDTMNYYTFNEMK